MTAISEPNVVLVVLDTARAMDTPPQDRDAMSTLSALAESGTAYANAFASAPWSLPSHASLFTGRFPSEHGAHGDHLYLDDDNVTLAEAFAGGGYETVGISNNTWITEEFGFARGFESYWKGWQYLQSETDIGSVVRAKRRGEKLRTVADHLFDGNPLVNAINVLYSEFGQSDDGAERTTGRVESWLRKRTDDRPFFLFVNYLEPHIEYRPPREYAERFLPEGTSYEAALEIRQEPRAFDVGEYDLSEREIRILRGLYRGELAYVDAHIGRLRSALADAGEWENTILAVVADHGENIGEHGLLGHQYSLYDTVLHVPLVVSGGAFDDGSTVDDPVQVPDLAPTLLDAAGLEATAFREQCRAQSFHPDAFQPREYVYAEYVSPRPPIETLEERFGDLPERVHGYYQGLRAIRSTEYKLVRGSDGREELYHVASDPAELTDRSTTDPATVAELGERLDRWFSSFGDGRRSGDVSVSDTTKQRLAELGYM